MLFTRNKISKKLKESKHADETSSEFDSLDTVRKNRWINRTARKVFVEQYHDGKETVKHHYNSFISYTKGHWYTFYKFLFLAFVLATFGIGLSILYKPFFMAIPGQLWSVANNFYLAKYVDNHLSFGLTDLGISFVVIFSITILMFIFYCVWSIKHKNFISNTNKATKIISYFSYAAIIVSFLLVCIFVFIPPQFSINVNNGQEATYLIQKITELIDKKEFDSAVPEIKKLYELLNLTVPTGTANEICDKFNKDKLDHLFFVSVSSGSSYNILQNSFLNNISNISVVGIVIVSLISFFGFVGFIALPIAIFIINLYAEYNVNEEIVEEWNSAKLFIFNFFYRIKSVFLKIFRRNKETENESKKKTYRKYKKEMDKSGESMKAQSEKFNSETDDNAKRNIITKQEIESHPANKAFLNNQAQWMYHDGNGNYFIVKNDEWVPYDINSEVHIAHVNAAVKEEEMSKKKIKENKIFKSSNKWKEKMSKNKQNDVAVDLPDDDLDRIIDELDI